MYIHIYNKELRSQYFFVRNMTRHIMLFWNWPKFCVSKLVDRLAYNARQVHKCCLLRCSIFRGFCDSVVCHAVQVATPYAHGVAYARTAQKSACFDFPSQSGRIQIASAVCCYAKKRAEICCGQFLPQTRLTTCAPYVRTIEFRPRPIAKACDAERELRGPVKQHHDATCLKSDISFQWAAGYDRRTATRKN